MANTRKEIVEELRQLLAQDVTEVKDQVDHLKTRFYSSEVESDVQEEELSSVAETETEPVSADE